MRLMSGINHAHLNTALQGLQDNPELVERSARRFESDEPPPPYSSAGSTEQSSPITFGRSQLSTPEKNELLSQPFTTDELDYFRRTFDAY